jgi:hypothetical protein
MIVVDNYLKGYYILLFYQWWNRCLSGEGEKKKQKKNFLRKKNCTRGARTCTL